MTGVASGGIVCGSRTFEGASPINHLQSSVLEDEQSKCCFSTPSPDNPLSSPPDLDRSFVDTPKEPQVGKDPTGHLPSLGPSSPQLFNPVKLVSQLVDSFWCIRSGLTSFARSSLQPACTVQDVPRGASLWPVPPPRWSWTGNANPGPRGRRRLQYFKTRHRLLRLVICSLNWECLGYPAKAPPNARLGTPLTDQQHSVIENLECMIDHFLHMNPSFGDLGRATEKFLGLINIAKELPTCNRFEDLDNLLTILHSEFDHYSNKFVPVKSDFPTGSQDDVDGPDHCCEFATRRVAATEATAGARPVIASRVKWQNAPSFDPTPFLDDPLVRAAYEDPEVLRKDPSEWPALKRARMHVDRHEFLDLVEKWDELGACLLIDAESKNFEEAVGIFCVPKDDKNDRLIINPTVINSRMHTVSSSTKELAPGAMLGLLSLKKGEAFRFCADDLTDFYYTFRVSPRRARRNAFRMIFNASDLQHLKSYDSTLDGKKVLVCLKTLAMGDGLAVEIAQQSHCNVLRYLCGSMIKEECLRYRFSIPRGDFVELLAIDDHIGIQRLRISQIKETPYLRDSQVFEAASRAYKRVGLIQQERKQKRNETSGILLGADFDGLKGRVMAPRSRILILSMVSLSIAAKGTCTPQTLSILNGCWVHVLLFRRVLFAVMNAIFHEGQDLPRSEVFCLSRRARAELQLLGVLGCLAQSNLRATYLPKIFSTDASPMGGAVCAADISESAASELWRHTEQRGFYTRLVSPVAEILLEKGVEPDSSHMFVSHQHRAESLKGVDPFSFNVPPPLQEGILYDCVELFRGTGCWSRAHSSCGLTIHDGYDVDGRRLRIGDLSNASTCREILALVLRRVVRDWHAGVPCLTFGTLRRPQLRSKSHPAGFDTEEPLTKAHNLLARRTAFLLTTALLLGQYISIEQPGSSRLFLLHCYRVMVMLGCVVTRMSFCSYGSGFQKPSQWLHNKPWIIPLKSVCNCPYRGNHFVVKGNFTRESLASFKERCRPSCIAVYGHEPCVGDRVSSYSAAYPLDLVNRMAAGNRSAKLGQPGLIPIKERLQTFSQLGIDASTAVFSPPPEASYTAREWYEDPEWISEICNALPFKELFRFKFHRSGHINVNEARTYKSWIKSMAKSHVSCRAVALLDSRVTIGAAAKGRSSSFAISRILQGCMGYVLGSDLYPGCLHCSSIDNRSDGPSRGRPVDEPTRDVPLWLSELMDGNPQRFDHVVASSRIARNPARWLRFLLLLAGDIEPNPGPRASRPPRGQMDMSVGFTGDTAARMSKCFAAFRSWAVERAELPWEDLVTDFAGLAWALRAYGLFCFETGLPRYMLVYAITATQEAFPAVRPHMGVAWQIDRRWQVHEPGRCRSVLPPVVIPAAIAIAAIWQWNKWVALVMLGFGAMLHPSELLALERQDLCFPSDLGFDSDSLYIHVKDPKTARFARRQHGRIDDPIIIKTAFLTFGSLPLTAKLYGGTSAMFRKQWNAVFARLGISTNQHDRGATPGVLRGSGATFLYASSEDVTWVAWRGRWSRSKTLEFYLQEVAAQVLIHHLDPSSKSMIKALSDAAWSILCCTIFAEQEVEGGSEIQASFHFSCLSKGKVAAVSNLSVGAGLNQANAAKKDRATSRTQAKRGCTTIPLKQK